MINIKKSFRNYITLSSGICVTKRTISNEIQMNNRKSCPPWKTPLLLIRLRDVWLKFVHEHKHNEKS